MWHWRTGCESTWRVEEMKMRSSQGWMPILKWRAVIRLPAEQELWEGARTDKRLKRAGTLAKVEALEGATAVHRAGPLFLASTHLKKACTRRPLGGQRGAQVQIDGMAVKALRMVVGLRAQ